MVVDLFDDGFWVFTAKKEVEEFTGKTLDHVE